VLFRSSQSIDELLETLAQKKEEPENLHDTLHYIAQTAKVLFNADICVIFAINPITGRFISRPVVEDDLLNENEPLLYECTRPRLVQQILKDSELLIEDTALAAEYHADFTLTGNIRSFVALALHTRQEQNPLGLLYLHYRQPKVFSMDDRNLFQIFTEQASFLLQKMWLLLRYQTVAHIGQDINRDLATASILFEKLKNGVPHIVDTQHALLLAIHQPHTDTIDLHLEEEGRLLFYEHVQGGACKYVMETQRPIFIKSLSHEISSLPFQIERVEETEPKEAFIFVPLILHGVSLGVLSVQHPQPNAYTQEDLSILQLLANHITLALHDIRQYDTLRRLYETGQLLTQHFDSHSALQTIIEKIHEATRADLAVLYAYEPALRRFVSPPSFTGNLLHTTSYQFLRNHQPANMPDPLFQPANTLFTRDKQGIFCQSENSSIQMWQSQFLQREEIRSSAILPLQVGDEFIGVLFIHFRKQQRFDDLQQLFIEGLAPYASIAIRNTSALDILHQNRRHDLKTLQNIDHELNQVPNLKHVFMRLLELACDRVPAEGASIWRVHPRTGALEPIAGINKHSEQNRLPRKNLYKEHGITQWVAQHKKAARVANVHRDRPWCDFYVQIMPATISELDVPILDDGEVIGVLNFESIRPNAFSQDDEDFLHTLAGQAVLAIRNAQTYEQVKRFAEEAIVLNDIQKEIIGHFEDHQQVFDLILKKALELTCSKTGVLMLYDAEHNDLWMAAEQGVLDEKKGQRHGLHEGIVGLVASTKKLLNVDLMQPQWSNVYLNFIPHTRYELAVPMLTGNKLRGVINIESNSLEKFTKQDERLLEGLADMAVVALQQTELYEKARNEKKRAQELEALSAIGHFAFELTHRWDNSLGLVASCVNNIKAELTGMGTNNEAINRQLGYIVQGVQKVLGWSKALKQVAASENDSDKFEITPIQMLFTELQEQINSHCPPAIDVEMLLDDDVADVEIIPRLISDCLRNIVSNAIEAMQWGGQLLLHARKTETGVAIDVTDTGIGIPEEMQAKIFDLFISTKGSSGFGLWSARTNALKNHGTLEVQSRPGQGTTFTLLLPDPKRRDP
jgi:GAF domain-containing protein